MTMTTEEKAKAYDEALERAKYTLTTDMDNSGHWAVKYIFPELKGSEDERVRKKIIDHLEAIKMGAVICAVDTSEEIAWLKKQKEQKPNIELIQRSWYMEGYHDREFGIEPIWIIKTGEGGPKHELNPKYGQPLAGEQKPAEWSEEDEENFKWFDKFFRAESIVAGGRDIPQDKYLWFKSLRNRPKASGNWKPSKEQMEVLEKAIPFCMGAVGRKAVAPLETLYNDLKKLMEE